jgi:hypothetical protein
MSPFLRGDIFMKKQRYIPRNPKREPLTVEKLRTFPGFENLSDEEAEDQVHSIHQFCEILMDCAIRLQKQKENWETP